MDILALPEYSVKLKSLTHIIPVTMKKFFLPLSVVLFSFITTQTLIAQNTGPHQYTTTLLRAAPGELPGLIEQLKQERTETNGNLLIMRHSQGDHWDLMMLRPHTGLKVPDYGSRVHFQHDFVVKSTVGWDSLKSAGANNGLYHIEMFHAKKGSYSDLLKQRQMENGYYHNIGLAGNVIFETVFGSDVDIYTLGFYKDIIDFATQPDQPQSWFDEAARKAGFSDQSELGFSLRRYILKHNDTLASAVR